MRLFIRHTTVIEQNILKLYYRGSKTLKSEYSRNIRLRKKIEKYIFEIPWLRALKCPSNQKPELEYRKMPHPSTV